MKRPKLRVIALVLLLASAAIFFIAVWVTHDIADGIMQRAESKALERMQASADSLADELRERLDSLSELNRLAALTIALDSSGDTTGHALSLSTLTAAMRANSLGIIHLQVIDPAGHKILELGTDPKGDLDEPGIVGLGRLWRTPDKTLAQHYTSRLVGHPDWMMSLTFDPDALSVALSRALPPDIGTDTAIVSAIARLSDGVHVARSAEPERLADAEIPMTPEELKLVRAVMRQARKMVSPVTGAEILLAHRSLPDLDLTIGALAPRKDLLANALVQEFNIRLIALVILPACLGLSALALALESRRRVQAANAETRLQAEAEAAVRAELTHLVSCSPAMLYRGRVDANGVYTRNFITPNSLPVTGWEPESLSDPDHVFELMGEEDRHIRHTNYAKALREGRASIDYRFLRPDGSYSWLRNEAVVIKRLPDGGAEVAGAVTNISHERELAASAALHNRMATLGEIATSLAHELTQPVTVIGMAASIAQSMAEDCAAPSALLSQITAILRQTDRAGEMIRHLRSYGHVEGGDLVAVDLRQAVAGAMSLAGSPLREGRVEVSLELTDDLPPVTARLVQVEQILVNLLMNARDALREVPAESRRVRIFATAGEKVRLCICDSGPGLSPDVQRRLFQAFFTTKPPGQGTGLGLSLCQTMMHGFGGDIRAENAPEGTMFTLEFLRATAVTMASHEPITAAFNQAS
jgi:C4-dicarboxylate-specific signal transduction histidine kinase